MKGISYTTGIYLFKTRGEIVVSTGTSSKKMLLCEYDFARSCSLCIQKGTIRTPVSCKICRRPQQLAGEYYKRIARTLRDRKGHAIKRATIFSIRASHDFEVKFVARTRFRSNSGHD